MIANKFYFIPDESSQSNLCTWNATIDQASGIAATPLCLLTCFSKEHIEWNTCNMSICMVVYQPLLIRFKWKWWILFIMGFNRCFEFIISHVHDMMGTLLIFDTMNKVINNQDWDLLVSHPFSVLLMLNKNCLLWNKGLCVYIHRQSNLFEYSSGLENITKFYIPSLKTVFSMSAVSNSRANISQPLASLKFCEIHHWIRLPPSFSKSKWELSIIRNRLMVRAKAHFTTRLLAIALKALQHIIIIVLFLPFSFSVYFSSSTSNVQQWDWWYDYVPT